MIVNSAPPVSLSTIAAGTAFQIDGGNNAVLLKTDKQPAGLLTCANLATGAAADYAGTTQVRPLPTATVECLG